MTGSEAPLAVPTDRSTRMNAHRTGSNPARARVVIVEDGRVALIKRVRESRTYYLFPGGGVEDGETPEHAAIREAHEELGVDVELGEPRYEEDFDRSRFVYFDARIVGGEFGTGLWPDHAERDAEARERSGTHEPVWTPIDELDRLDVRPAALVKLLRA
ncbi:MAG: NUDIX domain-containing protein [Actinomycetota bacterium]|nr:NUDIX domain-containing protein [Actinomycetota bacterium]